MKRALTNSKRMVAVLVVFCLMFSLIPANTFAVTASDTSGHWAQVEIQSWMDKGLIKGYPDGTFKPDQDVTRAEYMTLVNGAFDYTAKATMSYTDVKAGSWYAPEVAKAKAAGYVSGYPDGTMKPENPISREEVATIIARVKNLTSDANAADKYSDASSISSWSKGGVGAVTSAKIIQGYPDGSFMPQGLMTRAEVVVASDNTLHYAAPVATIAVRAITVTPTTMALTAGGATGAITATVSPSNATNKTVTWSSSNAAVAAVAGGVVTPVAAAAAVITATTVDGAFTAICTVTVTAPAATAPSAVVLAVGGTAPVGGVTNVAIPAAGATDSTGAVTGWVTTSADRIKFTVTDAGAAVSAITINTVAYTSGTDYTIAAATPLTIVVTTSEAGRVVSVRTFTVTVAAQVVVAAVAALAIGDNYQGGKIAYILQSGDPGYDSSVIHGLIAAPSDQSTGIIWAVSAYLGTSVSETRTALGSGAANTAKIIAQNGAGTTYAAGLARAYAGGGYTDWYLPSKDELNQLYLNKGAVGGFASADYWSSTEYNNYNACAQYFSNGGEYGDGKYYTVHVRAVRAF